VVIFTQNVLERVVEDHKELFNNSRIKDMDFRDIRSEDTPKHLSRFIRRLLLLVFCIINNQRDIVLRKDSDLYVYEVARKSEDCKSIYAQTIRFKKNDKVSYFDKDKSKWEIGTIKAISWKKIENKLTLVNEIETDKEKKVILVESKELILYFPKLKELNDVIKLEMRNRYMKEDGTKIYLEFPKMIAFGAWFTCSQVITEVLLQARHYMASYTQSKRALTRQFVSISIKKNSFVQYEENQTVGLPFEIILIDTNTDQCAICSSRQFVGEFRTKEKCSGCKIPDKNIPIRSILEFFGKIAICLNWTDIRQYGLPKETEDVNIKSLDMQENKTSTLSNCLRLLFKPVKDYINRNRRR